MASPDSSSALEQLLSFLHGVDLLARRNAPTRALGWRYHSWAQLLLDEGRVFIPTSPGGDVVPRRWRGRPGTCFATSYRWSTGAGLPYVEGLATFDDIIGGVEHAWCAGPHGTALDATWRPGTGLAYVGIPFTDAYRQAHDHPQLLVTDQDHGLRLLRDGLPPGARADAGHRLPTVPIPTLL